jgi:hypothetical protein
MVSARALGLLVSDPQRAHVALHGLRSVLWLPDNADGVGVGSCVDASVLLTRRPSLSPGQKTPHAGFAEVTGPLKGRTAVVQVGDKNALRPSTESPANLGPWRMRHYACAVVGGPDDADTAGRLRDELLRDLPDFLRRSVRGQSEGEAFFFAVMARLHERSLLDRTPSGEELADAVHETNKAAGDLPRHVLLANGTWLVHVSSRMPSGLVLFDFLDGATAEEVDPTLTDSSLARERLRRFRGVVVAGGLCGPLQETLAPVPGLRTRPLPDTGATWVGRDFEPQSA